MPKQIIYADVPEYDQATQAVYQTLPVDIGDYIFVGNEVVDLLPDEPTEDMRQ